MSDEKQHGTFIKRKVAPEHATVRVDARVETKKRLVFELKEPSSARLDESSMLVETKPSAIASVRDTPSYPTASTPEVPDKQGESQSRLIELERRVRSLSVEFEALRNTRPEVFEAMSFVELDATVDRLSEVVNASFWQCEELLRSLPAMAQAEVVGTSGKLRFTPRSRVWGLYFQPMNSPDLRDVTQMSIEQRIEAARMIPQLVSDLRTKRISRIRQLCEATAAALGAADSLRAAVKGGL